MVQASRNHADAVDQALRSADQAGVSIVAASWRRSALHHGLDPAGNRPRNLVSAEELAQLQEKHGVLLAVARPLLDQMFRTVGRSGCGVFLSNADGVILEERAVAADRADFATVGLVSGGRWGEAEEGTNGIGTCLFEDRPIVVHRDQHFAARNIGMSCMDTPIHDPEGRLVAALDVSNCRVDLGLPMVEMISALVREAGRRIERDYFCHHFRAHRILFLGEEAAAGAALLAVDRDGLVRGASRAACLRLGLREARFDQPRPLDEVMGREDAPSFLDADRQILRQALARAEGNASRAARALGIGRATFYRRMARAGLRG
ncbi:GAF domain-containing protein [Acidisoma sp. C75]